jgi:hypothetical protein
MVHTLSRNIMIKKRSSIFNNHADKLSNFLCIKFNLSPKVQHFVHNSINIARVMGVGVPLAKC